MIPPMKKPLFLCSLIVGLLIPSIAWAHDPAGSAGMGGGVIADILAIPTIIFLVIFYHKKKERPDHTSPIIGLVIFNYILYAILFISCLTDSRSFYVFCLFGFPSFSIFFVHFILHCRYRDRRNALQNEEKTETSDDKESL